MTTYYILFGILKLILENNIKLPFILWTYGSHLKKLFYFYLFK